MVTSGAQLYRLVDCSVLSYLVLLSFGETFWIQSVQFEVFTLNNLFVCITLFLTVRFFYLYWQEDVSKCISLFLCSNSVPSCSLGRFSRRFVTLQPAYDRFLPLSDHHVRTLHFEQDPSAQCESLLPVGFFVHFRFAPLFLPCYYFLFPEESKLGRRSHFLW